MINPHELNSQSHLLLAQRREEAEMHRLSQLMSQEARSASRKQQKSLFSQFLSAMMARLRVVRIAH